MSQIITHSTKETEDAGRKLASALESGSVIAFYGGLGMGKTAFIRGIASGLGVTDHVSSPTFAIVHEYRGRLPLYHFDMYRVTSWDDLESTGFYDYLEAGGVCAVEWSENIEQALPDETIRVEIAKGADDDTRIITIEGGRSDENTRS